MPDLPKDPPDLGSLQELRAALEGALLRCPAEAEPPELGPVLRLPLLPTEKLKLVQGKRILCDNLEWNPAGLPHGLEPLRTALNILEKYGRNLLSPRPPRHWRGVRFGNPVFKSTVGAIQGGREVLKLLGYTEESGEGLSFPPPPHGPRPQRVAAVTADVLVLRAELDLLLLNQHPNPQFFTQILLGGDEWSLVSDAVPVPAQLLPAGAAEVGEGWDCRSCTFRNPSPNVLCQVCERPRLARRPQPSPAPSQPWPCPRCTFLNEGHAPCCDVCGADHAPSRDVTSGVATPTPGVVSGTSGSGPATSGGSTSTSGGSTSTSGVGKTTSGSDPASSGVRNGTSGFSEATSGMDKSTSGVGNVTPGLAKPTSGDDKATSGTGNTTSGFKNSTSGSGNSTSGVENECGKSGNGISGCAEVTSGGGPAPSRDALRQRKLLEEGRRLVELVRAAESQGLPPESLGPTPFSNFPEASGPAPAPESQIRHFRSRLGGALKALLGAGPEEKEGVASLGPFSLAEAAWAWLEGEGQPERARRILIGRRKQQLRLLSSLGFPDPAHTGAALRRHRGSQWEALVELQQLKLRPFRLRHQQGAEPGLDFNQADQQALVRQILATLPVASWGRASLVAGLGRELGLALLGSPSAEPLLGELVEAVGSCPDRAALRRRLRCECAVCGWGLPRQRMQWLPGCSCPLCPECFRLHFTVGLRERGVANLGCPACGRPDLRDDAQRLWYWSTLEPALRRCLDPDTFGLVTRKLTELELQRDPQFLWCPHCSFGFIFEAERGPARCPQCCHCCCPRCQLPWDPRHSSLSCAEFGAWIRSRDPPGPPQGIGAFLGDTGIACPQCGQRFALARGGCLHFQCSQCRHQFCSGCGAQFHRPGACPSPRCPLGGSLHGHHPRDCLFFLRDWEPARLQRLLQSGDVAFETEPPPDAPPNPTGRCPVQELKDFGAALRDEPCGRDTEPGHAGLCTTHYTEYLVSLINRHGLDPAPLYDRAELRAAADRHLAAGSSQRLPGESEAEHELRMRRLLREEAPVRPRPQGAGLKGIWK